MPSPYNHPPQESLVQHFSTTHVDDLEDRVNQLMAARHAHSLPSHTHALLQSCSFCYHPSHWIDDCPFINYYMIEGNKSIHDHAQTTTKLVSEGKAVNNVEENEEEIEPPPTPNLSNDKEVSTEAHSFITIPLETFHEPQVSFTQCLKEPFYAKTLKDLCKQVGKPRNHRPKKILRCNKIGYIRWQNILAEGYQILKKKGWKGLVGHLSDRGKCGVLVFKFGGHPGLCTLQFLIPWYCIS